MALGLVGGAEVTVGGYLGGHLAYRQGVNVDRNAWEEGPAEWVDTISPAASTPWPATSPMTMPYHSSLRGINVEPIAPVLQSHSPRAPQGEVPATPARRARQLTAARTASAAVGGDTNDCVHVVSRRTHHLRTRPCWLEHPAQACHDHATGLEEVINAVMVRAGAAELPRRRAQVRHAHDRAVG